MWWYTRLYKLMYQQNETPEYQHTSRLNLDKKWNEIYVNPDNGACRMYFLNQWRESYGGMKQKHTML